MEKIVVVSTNNNPDYYFFSPYIKKAWANFGWKTACVITDDVDVKVIDADYIIQLPELPELRRQTQAQGGRLYACNVLPEDSLIMTSDMDLLPLSDYWHPRENEITVYGHDLTWFNYFPMGYIAMNCNKWKEVMQLTNNIYNDFMRDANETKIALMNDWENWWNFDWDLVTKRLIPYKQKNQITFINRGQIDIAGATLAKGRIDRYNWDATQNQSEPFIDAHCHNTSVYNQERKESFLKVFEKYHGKL